MEFEINNKIEDFPDPNGPYAMYAMERIAHFLLHSKIFNAVTLGSVHTAVHELGHACSHILLTGGSATVTLSYNSLCGETSFNLPPKVIHTPKQSSLISISGPLANMIFSILLIVGVFAITQSVPCQETSNWESV